MSVFSRFQFTINTTKKFTDDMISNFSKDVMGIDFDCCDNVDIEPDLDNKDSYLYIITVETNCSYSFLCNFCNGSLDVPDIYSEILEVTSRKCKNLEDYDWDEEV